MSNTYVNIPANKIEQLLSSKGFVRTIQGNEIVYVFSHKINPLLKVKVYTSIKENEIFVRGCGKDAIRVCGILETKTKTYGIAKSMRVNRTGTVEGVLERLLERARAVYARLNEWNKNQK
jgi:hypothetical protein